MRSMISASEAWSVAVTTLLRPLCSTARTPRDASRISAPASRATASATAGASRPSVEMGRASRVISACSGGRLLGEAGGPEAVVLGEVVEAERLADQRHRLLGATL